MSREVDWALTRVALCPIERLDRLAPANFLACLEQQSRTTVRQAREREELAEALYQAAGSAARPAAEGPAAGRFAVLALRRALHNGRPLRARDLALAGAALDPQLRERLAQYDPVDAEPIDELIALRREADAALWDNFQLESFQEALALTSRELARALRRLPDPRTHVWRGEQRFVADKGLVYLGRFATKTSPYGLFCGVALATIGDRWRLEPPDGWRRIEVLLSVAEARKVAAMLAIDPLLAPLIRPRVNPTLRPTAEGWELWRPATPREEGSEERRLRIAQHPIAALFIELAGEGIQSTVELLAEASARCAIEPIQLEPFFYKLVDRGVLLAEIEFPYNERRPLRTLADLCRAGQLAPPWLNTIESVESSVDGWASAAPAERERIEREISAVLEALPHGQPLRHDELLRVDLALSRRVTFPGRLVAAVQRAVALYARLFASFYPAERYRDRYKQLFLSRFPADRAIPLLDVYHGVFEDDAEARPALFPTPSSASTQHADAVPPAWERVRRHFIEQAQLHGAGGAWDLDEATVDRLVGQDAIPRWRVGALVQVAARDLVQAETGRVQAVLSSLFPGFGMALSRFAWLLRERGETSSVIERWLRHAWEPFVDEDQILAELSYNHFARSANAGLRPAVLDHEIELPGDKASPGKQVLLPRDLTVRWNSGRERFELQRASDQRAVLPVITSGVNPVGLIAFLTMISQQGWQPLGYFPGFDAPEVVAWPRVTCGSVVLFRARWSFRAAQWPDPPAVLDDRSWARFARHVAEWREAQRLPRRLFISSDDEPKPQFLDFAAPPFIDRFARRLQALARQPAARLHLTEMLPDRDQLWLTDHDGVHASEFLLQVEGGGAS